MPLVCQTKFVAQMEGHDDFSAADHQPPNTALGEFAPPTPVEAPPEGAEAAQQAQGSAAGGAVSYPGTGEEDVAGGGGEERSHVNGDDGRQRGGPSKEGVAVKFRAAPDEVRLMAPSLRLSLPPLLLSLAAEPCAQSRPERGSGCCWSSYQGCGGALALV